MFYNRFSAVSFVISGILFVLYPIIRPFSDETTLAGAAAFGSTNWLIAHMFAMVAFTLLLLGFLNFHLSIKGLSFHKLSYIAFVFCILGVGLTLPFYGGEAFGLHAIGQEALTKQSIELVRLANVVRSGPGLIMFLIGLLLLAISSIFLAITFWKSGIYMKWWGLPYAFGISLYIPQFFAGHSLRVAHGFLVALGCIMIAMEIWKQNDPKDKIEN
ncbi:hypothetical protein HPT25_22030 [Bacillus sp. BRMEA1]|uniref:hypothetical protein n=1 Tax=Neobacillus endophyticus TaxID=2738405 RepID=UPI0015630854|nr:hypothetical protein [Neobacillus endophyticus]NRD80019.1 hypothetical protein [Neobacillus endophyticus]